PTRVFAGGADTPLALDSMPYTALITNYSGNFAAPDRAAAATAIATGVKVNNKSAGGDSHVEAPTLLELARQAGRATGLVTDGKITNPTTAAFYAQSDVAAQVDPARHVIETGKIDLVLGGGTEDFLP